MDAVQCPIHLQGGQYVGDASHRRPRTRNVTFPSLKKYASCLMNESSEVTCPPLGVILASEQLGRFVCLAPRPALGSSEAVGDFCERLEYVSENVESNETMVAALDRTGDMEISLSLQETMRGAIKRKILYLMSVCRTWHTACNGYVTTHEESLRIPKTVFQIHNHNSS
jgi:hypothetical protein